MRQIKINVLLVCFAMAVCSLVQAQHFISEAKIEYEVKANIKKTMGNNTWQEMLKENLPTFKTGYYTLTFANNKSVFKFDHWEPNLKVPEFLRKSDEENIWFIDYNTGAVSMQKNIAGSNLVVNDSVHNLNWKLSNESRIIAGFNCRKAVAQIFDSVYVFAFYTDEILLPGGPCSINGLPGTILGLTIPRLFTSWIATKVMVNNVDVNSIKPVTSKKPLTMSSMTSFLTERTKDWYSDDAEENKEIQEQKSRILWTTLL
jgi:GLPGLI family protein